MRRFSYSFVDIVEHHICDLNLGKGDTGANFKSWPFFSSIANLVASADS